MLSPEHLIRVTPLPVPSVHRSSEVVEVLAQEILDGTLVPGERLPSEERLCTRFDVSRTVIREAIQQLRGRGLIRTRKGSGSYIADPSLDSLASALEAYSILTPEESFLQLIDFRILLETECARLAAHEAGESDLDEIERHHLAIMRAAGDAGATTVEDVRFHLAIARASRNPIYSTILRGLEKRFRDYARTNQGDENWHTRVVDSHAAIVTAIRDGQPEEAANAMRRHLLLSRRHYIDIGGA